MKTGELTEWAGTVVTIKQGSVVWKVIPDESGKKPKRHPILIVSNDSKIAANDEIWGVVASHTAIKYPDRDNCYVHLPHTPAADIRKTFNVPTVAVCRWTVKVKQSEISSDDIVYAPLKRVDVERVIDKMRELIERKEKAKGASLK